MEHKSVYVTGVINVEFWDEACWRGIAILSDKKSAPYFGFLFENREAAVKIFREWNERFGHRDLYEEIRIAVIEGDIPGKELGYTVHITTNTENLISKCNELNLPVDRTLFALISRFHRMPTENGNRNINIFRQEIEKFLSYKIIPVYMDGNALESLFDYEIEKTEIVFKHVNEIAENDIDIVCIK